MKFVLNGKPMDLTLKPGTTLLRFLREELGLTGAKEGCGKGECGACTVIVNKKAVASCILPAEKIEGAVVETIEGIGNRDVVHPLQEAFMRKQAVQCGFCTPGVILTAKGLLDETVEVSRSQIRREIAGNLCRCTGYNRIIEAIEEGCKVIGSRKASD